MLDVLEPSEENNVIINLPVTVEMSSPHVYASQVEYMSENLKYREHITLSVHPHNDRGTGVADTELALLAGADRVEGTLFGNGERTGNVDIITLAMNMYSHGVDPKLDFSNMNALVETYERCTRMHVYERAPYAGALVFAAFSGSHQDAIAKGMKYRSKNNLHEWNVPYIPIDPKDIGRTYDADVIRVNSQSGKGGIGYLLEQTFGYNLPPKMREHFSYICKEVSDHQHKELKPDEVLEIFTSQYLNLDSGIKIADFDFERENDAVKIIPEAERRTITIKPTETIQMLTEEIALRAERIYASGFDPQEDNMLKVTGDGKRLALDARTFDPNLPDERPNKLSVCAGYVYAEWKNSREIKGTQLVFCDLSTPKKAYEDYEYGKDFDAYNDLKYKLVEYGIPEKEIAYIHEANTDKQKQDLFNAINAGTVRVLIGSTEKCGAGTNVQERLVALHHLDAPSSEERRVGKECSSRWSPYH